MAKDRVGVWRGQEDFRTSIEANAKLTNYGAALLYSYENFGIIRCTINVNQALDANEYMFNLPSHTYVPQANTPIAAVSGSIVAVNINSSGEVTANGAIAANLRFFILIPIFLVG